MSQGDSELSKPRRRLMVVRPLREENAKAKALGFRMQMHLDRDSRTMRIRLVPETAKARAACSEAAGVPGGAIEAGVVYGDGDSVHDVAIATASVALARAVSVMGS